LSCTEAIIKIYVRYSSNYTPDIIDNGPDMFVCKKEVKKCFIERTFFKSCSRKSSTKGRVSGMVCGAQKYT
jgi:hypothetical protein